MNETKFVSCSGAAECYLGGMRFNLWDGSVPFVVNTTCPTCGKVAQWGGAYPEKSSMDLTYICSCGYVATIHVAIPLITVTSVGSSTCEVDVAVHGEEI